MGLIESEENGDNNEGDNNAYSPSSYCYYEVNPNGDGNDDAVYQDDQAHFYDYSGWTSYGTGCKSGTYVYNKFDGAFCKGANVSETVDTFDTFNQGMANLDCVQIFGGEEVDNDENGPALGSLLGILRYSRSCSLYSYPNQCPDPYGLKIKYVKNLE